MKGSEGNEIELGDLVYYTTPEGDTVPTEVLKVGRKRVKVENMEAKAVWVNPSNCEVQSNEEGALVGKWNYTPEGALTTTFKDVKRRLYSNPITSYILKREIYVFVGIGYIKEGVAVEEDYFKTPTIVR